jgi:glycosidase
MAFRLKTRSLCLVLLGLAVLAAACRPPGAESRAERTDFSNTPVTGRCSPPPGCPEWVERAVFYQIYPQTFFDSNGDGIGDLPGIVSKLDYVKSLGVDAVWINPFFDSPFLDAGYDIRDYRRVAPRYGTNEDAKRLFAEAHRRGLKVLFDFVASYTSIEHPWFQASCRSDSNRYSNWYVWTDNMWVSEDAEFPGRFIQGYGTRNGQFMRNFFWSQPALNYGFAHPDPKKRWQLGTHHPDVTAMREEMKSVLRFWMDMGADGFRADMAGALVKGRNPDPETVAFWREVRGLLSRDYPEAFMISEWSNPKDALNGAFHADFFHWFEGYNDLTQKESWRILNGYSDGHSWFDAEGKGNLSHFLVNYLDQYEATKGKGYISLPIGNHDLARLGNRRTAEELELIYAFGICMPGVPFIYYGNEIGMRQLDGLPQIEGAYRPRAGARTPMQWSRGKNLGFSSAPPEKLYLPVDPAADAPTVADQEADPHSLLARTRKLVWLKHVEPALSAYAEFSPLFARENAYPFVFGRASGKDAIVVALNPSGREAGAEFTLSEPWSGPVLLAGKDCAFSMNGRQCRMRVPATSYAIYKLH